MGPAIALRLRQHLTLTPQVQQALKLLQMSALEFQQEMDQALAANPFLEEKTEAPQPPASADPAGAEATPEPAAEPPAETRIDAEADLPVAQEYSSPGGERDQDDWGGV